MNLQPAINYSLDARKRANSGREPAPLHPSQFARRGQSPSGFSRFPEIPRDRFLSPDEIKRLADVLADHLSGDIAHQGRGNTPVVLRADDNRAVETSRVEGNLLLAGEQARIDDQAKRAVEAERRD